MPKYLTPWRVLIGIFFAITAVIVFLKFYSGLGAVTALNDKTPWGIWVGFDILTGVALAAGGFVMAATVYVFQIKRFKPMVRMAILTAMLGYLLFIVGLIIEIGRPWNMWRVITNPNFHSPLYEVAMCVILYTTVLVLEFSLVVFERLGWNRLVHFHHKVSVFLVVTGVLLSTLHQSTLGTLFTIAPHKMHPLWYSQIQPIHFFVSCVAAGIGMIAFEAFLSYRFTKHPIRMDLLTTLLRVMAIVLVIFFCIRIGDLVVRGEIGHIVKGKPAALFWMENLLFVFTPLFLIIRSGKHFKTRTLFATSFCVVLGLVFHRFNIAVSSFQFVRDTGYFPTWTEFMLSVSLVCAGFVGAGLAIYFFPMHPEEPKPADDKVFRVPWTVPAKESQ
jgi:Ni/Fe-hydrogenase subunit HybB-like protein